MMRLQRSGLLPLLLLAGGWQVCLVALRAQRPSSSPYADLLGPLLAGSLQGAGRGAEKRASTSSTPSVAGEYAAEPLEDPSNERLVANVDPRGRSNPDPQDRYDLLVIGAGVAGLISCIVARQLGRKVAMVERHYMGGDCLNTGCVPSKALIAAARQVALLQRSSEFGISLPPGSVAIDFAAVMTRMRRIRAEISEHDSVQRYSAEVGVDVFAGQARFVAPDEVLLSSGEQLRFRKCILGTGASARVPEALRGVPHLTSGNLWNLQALPRRLVVLGAGPIGLEIAQAMQRLGSQVTVLTGSSGRVLGKEEPMASAVVKAALERDGVVFEAPGRLVSVERQVLAGSAGLYEAPFATYEVKIAPGEGPGLDLRVLQAEAVLNATGRIANTHGLELDSAGVAYVEGDGIEVDEHLQTTNPDVFAAGDCLPDGNRFTHAAEWQARVAVRNALLGEGLDSRRLLVPRATYTDPEVASVGQSASELEARGIEFETYTRDAADVDRNRCDGINEGFATLHVSPQGYILGATVVGHNAGDHISEITLCMQHNLTAADLAGTMHPYPTAAEVVRQAAQAYVRSRIFKPSSQQLLRCTSEACDSVKRKVTDGGLALIELDRPKALHACTPAMARSICEAARSPRASALLLLSSQAGQPGRAAFCAGGDVKALAAALRKDPKTALPTLQLAHEYAAVAAVSRRREESVPAIAFMDGITMGFGLGLAAASEYRIVTERSVLAMPECAIGIAPDAGFAAIAAAMPPGVGMCMALTGWRLGASEALDVGLATHFVKSEELSQLLQDLGRIDWTLSRSPEEELAALLGASGREVASETAGLMGVLGAVLEEVFAQAPDAKTVRARLKSLSESAASSQAVRNWAAERLAGFDRGCLLAQEVSFRLLRAAETALCSGKMDRHRCVVGALERDFAATSRLLRAPDFLEGVRATLDDKDGSPQWVSPVDEAEITRVLATLPSRERVAFAP